MTNLRSPELSPAQMDVSEKIRTLYRENPEEGFRFLFEVCHKIALSFSLRIVGDENIAKDVVQDCFVDFWISRRIETVSGDIVKYMLSATMYASLNYLRKNKRFDHLHNTETLLQQFPQSETEQEYVPEIKKIYENISTLPRNRREIFIMIAIEGMKYQDVADKLGISINTVKTQMKRAVKTLRLLSEAQLP